MGIFKAISGAIDGNFADQWKDIIEPSHFDEYSAVVPGTYRVKNNGRGENFKGSVGVISNGSIIIVPENTAVFIFDNSGIETIIATPGKHVYSNGEASLFTEKSIKKFLGQVTERFEFGGQPSSLKHIAYVNLREIRNLKFGTRGPLMYHDAFYDTDLEILARGVFSIQVINTEKFIRNFVPANTVSYSFSNKEAREQIISEFLHSFIVAITSLSNEYRISQLPIKSTEITTKILESTEDAGTWSERFGFEVKKISIESIEFAKESKDLVQQFSKNKMNVKAYDNVSQRSADMLAQQRIAEGVSTHGLGNLGGALLGVDLSKNISTNRQMSLDEQIDAVKKLKELVDMGILTEAEFEVKKKEIMNL